MPDALALRAEQILGDVLELPGPFASDDPIREKPGDTIGPYTLLAPIGEVGFGVVFMAEKERPVRRMVAVKVIKLGTDTKGVVAAQVHAALTDRVCPRQAHRQSRGQRRNILNMSVVGLAPPSPTFIPAFKTLLFYHLQLKNAVFQSIGNRPISSHSVSRTPRVTSVDPERRMAVGRLRAGVWSPAGRQVRVRWCRSHCL